MPELIGYGVCAVCGHEVDVKSNKNNKIYYFCDCGASIKLGGAQSRKGLASLARGEKFENIKPLNFRETDNGTTRTSGNSIGQRERNITIDDDDVFGL